MFRIIHPERGAGMVCERNLNAYLLQRMARIRPGQNNIIRFVEQCSGVNVNIVNMAPLTDLSLTLPGGLSMRKGQLYNSTSQRRSLQRTPVVPLPPVPLPPVPLPGLPEDMTEYELSEFHRRMALNNTLCDANHNHNENESNDGDDDDETHNPEPDQESNDPLLLVVTHDELTVIMNDFRKELMHEMKLQFLQISNELHSTVRTLHHDATSSFANTLVTRVTKEVDEHVSKRYHQMDTTNVTMEDELQVRLDVLESDFVKRCTDFSRDELYRLENSMALRFSMEQ